MCLLLWSGYHLATILERPDWWSAAEKVVLLEGSPIHRIPLWRLEKLPEGQQSMQHYPNHASVIERPDGTHSSVKGT